MELHNLNLDLMTQSLLAKKLAGYQCITQAVNRIQKLNSLLQTFWPSPWNVCVECGRYTHPLKIESNLNVPQEFETLELCSCGTGASGLEQWVEI